MRRSVVAVAGASIATMAMLALVNSAALAQGSSTDHTAHHPGASPVDQQTAPAAQAAVPALPRSLSAPGATGCAGMMGCMGGGARPFYSLLLDMPTLTPESRRFIEAEADRRIGWGAGAVSAGHSHLEAALVANDIPAAATAAVRLRDGLLNIESGTAMLRAVSEGTSPRQIALTWFRDGLSLPSPEAAPVHITDGPWGLSWYHLTTMAFLVVFLVATLVVQIGRSRRINALVGRLEAASSTAAQATAATVAAAPSAPASAPLPANEPSISLPAAPAPSPMTAAAAARRPWSGQLRLAAIFAETPTVKTFRLVNPEVGDIPFTFLPGQFLTFAAEVEGKTFRRSYTIASSPTQRGYVEVTVKREEQGAISRHLHDEVVVGDLLDVAAPSGIFTFTGGEADSIVLIAGGVGITPMMSVIRYLTDTSYPGEIYFLYGARTTADFIFREELEYLQKRHRTLHLAATMSRADGAAWMGPEGPISKEFIARTVPEIARRRVHLCGPPPMMEAVRAALADLGVPKEQVKTEAFGPAKGFTPGPAAPLPASITTAPFPSAATAIPVARIATAEVRFAKSGKTGALEPDQTVLEAAEAVGVSIDYSCRVGVCGACRVPLLKGEVTMAVEEGLPPDEKARGIILACQAKSLGNLEVEA